VSPHYIFKKNAEDVLVQNTEHHNNATLANLLQQLLQ